MLVEKYMTFLFSGEFSLIGNLLLPGRARAVSARLWRNKSYAVSMRNAIQGNDLKFCFICLFVVLVLAWNDYFASIKWKKVTYLLYKIISGTHISVGLTWIRSMPPYLSLSHSRKGLCHLCKWMQEKMNWNDNNYNSRTRIFFTKVKVRLTYISQTGRFSFKQRKLTVNLMTVWRSTSDDRWCRTRSHM